MDKPSADSPAAFEPLFLDPGTCLTWYEQRWFPRRYELTDAEGGVTYGSLAWERVLSWHATGTTRHGTLTFDQEGFWRTSVIIGLPPNWVRFGVLWFESPWTSTEGQLHLGTGAQYTWIQPSMWKSEWQLVASSGSPIISVRSVGLFKRGVCTVELHASATECPDLPVLVLLSMYMYALIESRRAAGSAAAAGAV